MATPHSDRVTASDGRRYPKDRAALRNAIKAAIEANPQQTNTQIAKALNASRDTVIDVRKSLASALVDSRYEAMCIAIAECAAVDEVKDIRDKARALEIYTQQAQNKEAEEKAREIRLRAERRGGEIMLKQIKAAGGTPYKAPKSTGAIVAPVEKPIPTLADQGISKRQASDWQTIAKLPEETFEAALADPEQKPTTKSLVDIAKATPTTTVNGSPQVTREVLTIHGYVTGFERHNFASRDPAEVYGGMVETMQEQWQRIVPVMLEWLARLPFMKENS